MNTLISIVVAALKAAVSGTIKNEIISALAEQGIKISLDKFIEYTEKTQKEVIMVLSDGNLNKMNISENHTEYVRAEIKELFRKVDVTEEMFRKCQYDADSLAEILYSKYRKQDTYSIEYEGEIRTVLSAMCEKVISLEKGREGFIEDGIIQLINSVEEIKSKLNSQDEIRSNGIKTIELERDSESKMRLPDRTEEYYRKWTENMFLNDFDEDDEDAGENIPLWKLYQPLFYKLKGQKKDLSNLEERLNKCTRGQDLKSRMLLILGQPGMGKSTMITWFLNWYPKKSGADKKEILVYRFTDLNIDWSFNFFGEKKREERIDFAILDCLNMKKRDLHGKILILDGFDEVSVGNNRAKILNCLYNAWARDNHIKDFSLLVTCRENYIEDLSQLTFPYITLQPWNESQIGSFCKQYGKYAHGEQAELRITREAIEKMKKMRNIFGIPILLYMTLALEITIRDESSIVEVYDQIFNLEKGGLYDRCLRRKILLSYDGVHRIAVIKKQIHQFSRKISIWMFEYNPEQAAIPKSEYEKIQDEIFEKNNDIKKLQKKDVLIGNYFRMVHCYDGVDTEKLTFVHRSIYEYFVAETISSEIREAVAEMTEEAQESLARVLGYRLKKGNLDYTIGQYLKAKVSTLIVPYSEDKKKNFYIWLEGTVGKMLNTGMLYYTGENIKKYRNVIGKELRCFLNILNFLRLFIAFSDQKYLLHDVNQKQMAFYIKCLADYANYVNIKEKFIIDLNNTYLRGADLRGVNLAGSKLIEADLRGANLTGADLREANLTGADLKEINLNEINLRGANLRGANLAAADLTDSKLIEADLKTVNLTGTKLVGADLTGADLRKSNLSGANLRGANLATADLTDSKLIEVNLRGANLVGAKLIGTDLRKSNLAEADLKNINLRGANLAGINLIQADLRETNLARADLSKANLTGSNLIKSDLTSTKLIAAKLRKINATGANLIGADLTGTDLRESNLAGSKLIGVDLREANLIGADLREANISSSRWTREDIFKYIDLIRLAKFSVIYLDSKKFGKNIELTRGEFLSQYPS